MKKMEECSVNCLIVMNTYKDVLIHWIQAPKMMNTIMAFVQSTNSRESAYFLFQTQPIHELLHENLHREKGKLRCSCDYYDRFQTWSLQIKNIMQSARLASAAKIFIIKFWSHLVNHKLLLHSGARWQIWGAEQYYLHKHWFLNKCLVQGRQNMEERDSKVFMQSSCLLRRATTVSGSVLRFRARKKGCCICRKQESILELECGPAFCVIGEAQFLCFTRLYTDVATADAWPGESKFVLFPF